MYFLLIQMEITSTTKNAGDFHVTKTLLEDDEEPHYLANITCPLIVLEKNINILLRMVSTQTSVT